MQKNKKSNQKKILLTIILLMCITTIYASDTVRISIQPTINGLKQPNKEFTFDIIFSNDTACHVLKNETRTVTTDTDGVAVIDIDVRNITFSAPYLCLYENGIFRSRISADIKPLPPEELNEGGSTVNIFTGLNATMLCYTNGSYCSGIRNGTFMNVSATNGTTHTFTFTNDDGTTKIISIDDTTGAAGGSAIQGARTLDTYILVTNSTVINISLNITAMASNCSGGEYSRWNGSKFICVTDNVGTTNFNIAANGTAGTQTIGDSQTINFNGTYGIDITRSTFTINYAINLAQLISNFGNWSADKNSYTLLSQFNSNNNFSLAQIAANIGNDSTLDRNKICYSNQSNCAGITNGTGGSGYTQWTLSNGSTTIAILNNTRVNLTPGLGMRLLQSDANISFNVTLADFTTTQLAEGTNQYYTFTRWLTSFNAANIWNGTAYTNQICYSNGSNCAGITNGTGSGASNAGWLNATDKVYLANNNTNVTVGQFPIIYFDTTYNRTGINTGIPGATLDVNGTINATTLQTSGTTRISSTGLGTFATGTTINSKGICLGDGTNCPGIQNGTVTSIANGSFILGGTITTTGTHSLDTASLIANIGNWSADKASYSTTVAGDQRWLGLSNSGWLNISGSGKVGLANNNTNLTVGTVALFVNTLMNFTGINTTTPGSTLDVRGTINATNILQAGKTICLGDGTNCPSTSNTTSRGGNVSGGGSANYIPRWSNSTDLTNSIIQDSGTLVNISGNLSVGFGGNTTASWNLAGTTLTLNISIVPGTSGRFGIDEAQPTQKFHVNGNINTTGNISITGNISGIVMSNLTLGCAGIATMVGGSSGGITTPCMRGVSSHVFFSDEATSLTNVGSISVTQRNSNGTFVLTSSNVLDTSPFAWFIVQMNP